MRRERMEPLRERRLYDPCERCIGSGWVRDLKPRDGRCPFCGWERFTYRREAFIPSTLGPLWDQQMEEGRDGRALIERMEAHRSDLFEKWV